MDLPGPIKSLVNMHQVYETAKLIADKGCQKLFLTRSVPPTYSDASDLDDYSFTPQEVKKTLDDALRAKHDCGIMVGSLVSYPLCFLLPFTTIRSAPEKYCPSEVWPLRMPS